MEERLEKIFSNVNEWLKFAEAKNGVLVALNGGVIFAFLSAFGDKLLLKGLSFLSLEFFVGIFCWEFLICSCLSLLISLLSFFPQTKEKAFWFPSTSKKRNDNLLFYSDIQKYTPLEFLNLISETPKDSYNKSEVYFARQIITNSRITHRKVTFFKAALFFNISAIVTFVFGIALFMLFSPNNE